MIEAVVKSVLGKLSSFAGKELELFLSFDQDLKKLANTLTIIMATLADAEEKQFSDSNHSKSIKDWLGKLNDAAHELDDIMDEHAYEELRVEYEGVKCCLSEMVLGSSLSSFHPMHLVYRYKIAKKMKRISERLDQIDEDRKKFHLTETTPERRSGDIEWRQTSSIITEPQIYGREEDRDKIVDFLVGDASHSEDLSIYPIIGLGGLGKTTLTKLIYKDEKVVKHFELIIWVCVSEDFSLRRMTKAIIVAASGSACEDVDLDSLQRRLQDLLQRKRYLLVLDDVWNNDQQKWQNLKSVLACGAKGASILVTTRLPTVAAIMGTMPPHKLSMLSDNYCWELFKHQAFGPNEVEQVELEDIIELEDIGKEIVKKCCGVPLAAKTLGGLLRFKRKKKEWTYVNKSNLWNLPQHGENSIMSALRLSYLNLPINLRQCFAYCAIFRKDEIIRKQYLIELWMANGFISSNEILHAEDVGDGVWHELYRRSFFQDIEKDEFGKVKSFKMHDLVHDLAQFVAEEVCCITDDHGVTTKSERIHHVSDHRWMCNSSEEAKSIQLHRVKSLRTCISPYRYEMLMKCYSLRVLHCEPREELLSSIGDLKHLRYLNLSGSGFKTLPESLGKLWNLQILKLDDCELLEKLPNSLIHLKALQQLSFYGCSKLSTLPPQIGKLTSLRSLTTYFVGKERGFHLAELGRLKLKGDLLIKHLGEVKSVKDAEEANMSSKQLNELWLSWDRNDESDEESKLKENVEKILEVLQPDTQQLQSLVVQGYKGVHFPQWMSSSSLKKLQIMECYTFHESEGLHKALQHMTVLKELKLESLPNLESLPDCFEKLSSLRELTIGYCSKLRCLPGSLSHSRLKILRIFACPELQKRCEKETGEDWPKIAHIPQVHIRM